MASPFDFSSFLLTPPIPNTPSNNTQQLPSGGSEGQQHSSSGGGIPLGQVAYSQQSQIARQQQQPQNQHISLPGRDQLTVPEQYQQHRNRQPTQRDHSSSGPSPGSASSAKPFDERDYGLDPSAFGSVSFAMPSFLTASSNPDQFGSASSIIDPSAFHAPPAAAPTPHTSQQQNRAQQPASYFGAGPGVNTASQPQNQSLANQTQSQSQNSAEKQRYVPNTRNPVYGMYGSSVISVNPDPAPFKLALNAAQEAVIRSQPLGPPETPGTTPDFDPAKLGLPVGNQLFPQPLPGLYSSSGFDMLGVLARVVARPNPQINIGPVDTSCSFLVVDARRYDMPIVFASETFTKLTGYSNAEIIGRNCRFMQAPDGHVAMGSRRKYTDGNAVYHLKSHIQSGKECQASVINYRKDGSPFINLVTVIPITWDTDEIAYFVGFQVDLVEQPNAILEKMRDGTYVVNYSLLPAGGNQSIDAPPTLPQPSNPPEDTTLPLDVDPWSDQNPVKVINPGASASATAAAAQTSMTIAPELLEVMGQVDATGDIDVDDETAKKKWNKMLLDNTGDFVHVLSLKGSFLYVSPSVRTMLEYEPSDLIGKTLQSVCHPSDIVPVMRELKEASTTTHPIINLLYRFRRKSTGYIWMEAQGKLYLEQSKSRKCVILVGRERPVYKLAWNDLRAAGGLGEKEFWSKISIDGMFLYNSPTVKTVLGYEAEHLRGANIFEHCESDKTTALTQALQDAASGKSVRLHYKLRSAKGALVDVITNFYPNSQPADPNKKNFAGIVHPSIIAQTNEYSSEMRRRATANKQLSALPNPSGVLPSPGLQMSRPTYHRNPSSNIRDMVITTSDANVKDGSDSSGSPREGSGSGSASGLASGSDSSAPSTFSAIPSTFKTLNQHPSMQSANVFDELDTTRTTSWQYELHQLKLTNKKLKEELTMLQAAKRKRKKKEDLQHQMEMSGSPAPANTASIAVPVKSCANCGRTDSPEWRVGPSGARNLCNACGLRWAKATRIQRQNSHTGSSTPTSSASELDGGGPLGFAQNVAGPFAPATKPF